jgi:transposase
MWRPAMEKIGIDVHKTSSQVCGVTENGELVEWRMRTSRDAFGKHFGRRPAARILIEASTESEWVARCLEELGHEVVVADPNFAPMYATRSRRVKTDRRDARALCDACRLGAYRRAHRSTDESRHRRAGLAVREALVSTRTKMIALCRALVRREGLRVPSGGAATFARRLSTLALSEDLREEVTPIVSVLERLNEQIALADKRVEQVAKDDALVERLRTTPGVGPVTAVSFVATLDGAERFSSARQVRAYVGLVPREMSSSERQIRGHITKAGNRRIRSLLVEAAWSMLRHRPTPASEALVSWAKRIAARRGKRIAAVALARKLAGILYAMCRDGTLFGERSEEEARMAA